MVLAAFLLVGFFVFDVALGVVVDGMLVGVGEGAAEFAGVAHEEAAGGDVGAFGDESAGGNDGAGADSCAVEDDRAHADEAAGFDGAAVEDDAVANGDVVAEDERVRVAHNVEDTAVLDIGAGADADVMDVAADDGAGPDAGVGGDGDVADDDGLRIDVGGIGDAWRAALIRADQIDSPLRRKR